jgi:hypothetical protein
MNSAAKEYSVFLSYAHADEPWVAEFAGALQKAGFHAFDPTNLPYGQSYVDTLEVALRQSDTLIIFLSVNSIENPNVLFELGAGVGGNKLIIPVLIGDIELHQLPRLLSYKQVIRSTSPAEAAQQVARLIESGAQNGSKPH